jgi:hypothetical protein
MPPAVAAAVMAVRELASVSAVARWLAVRQPAMPLQQRRTRRVRACAAATQLAPRAQQQPWAPQQPWEQAQLSLLPEQ